MAHLGLEIPFLDYIGLEVRQIEPGQIEVTLPLQKHHTNSYGIAHGGVVMTLLDVAMAMSAKTKNTFDGSAMTIDMHSSFMRGAKGSLTVKGKVLRGGKSIQFCEAEAFDESGEMVAKAMGTFKLV